MKNSQAEPAATEAMDDSAADRAIDGLACDAEARRMAGAALAIEDLVRDWYGGIP